MYKNINIYPESSCKVDVAKLKDMMHSGMCTLTLRNSVSKVQKTYAFFTPRDGTSFPKDTLFVYSLVQSNTWLYVGRIDNDLLKATRASRFSYKSKTYKGAQYLVNIASGKWKLDDVMSIYHCGTCCVCGRRLTSYKSIIEGVGPRCKKAIESRRGL